MEQELISKKQLLELADISYGQLYRWKRERLLPEEWFIKRSSYTGQETFFPRVQALERINMIKELKDDHSLEAIAEFLSPQSGNLIAIHELEDILDVDEEYLKAVTKRLFITAQQESSDDSQAHDAYHLSFNEVVLIGALGELVKTGTLAFPPGVDLAFGGGELAQQWVNDTMSCDVLSITSSVESDSDTASDKSPMSWHLVLYKDGVPPLFSQNITVVTKLPLEVVSATIKDKLKERTLVD